MKVIKTVLFLNPSTQHFADVIYGWSLTITLTPAQYKKFGCEILIVYLFGYFKTMVSLGWSATNSCVTLYDILLSYSINSIYLALPFLTFQASLLSCHELMPDHPRLLMLKTMLNFHVSSWIILLLKTNKKNPLKHVVLCIILENWSSYFNLNKTKLT